MSFSNFFVPTGQVISTITRANPAVVTTVANHGYSSGLIVQLFIPKVNGMQQLNQTTALITVLSSNSFSIPVNSTNFDSFTPGTTPQTPQVIPVGSISKTILEPVQNNGTIISET